MGVRRVRWDTEYEDDDINEITNGRTAEDFARALDKLGWMIVVKPEFADGSGRWPLDPKYGPVPTWADDMSTCNNKRDEYHHSPLVH
jgi:hypothetical protein